MTPACAPIRQRLDAYFDGELNGAERLRVARHVAGCEACARELNEIRALGDLLRSRAAAVPPPPQFAGLAAGVVSRTRAEASQSWMAMWHRAVEDWQWALVGAGSLCAAVVSVLNGAHSLEQLEENVQLIRQPIPAELWQELKAEGLLPAEAPTPS